MVGIVEEVEDGPRAVALEKGVVRSALRILGLHAVRACRLPGEPLRGARARVAEALPVDRQVHLLDAIGGLGRQRVGKMRILRTVGVDRIGELRGRVEEGEERRVHAPRGAGRVLRSLFDQQLLQVLIVEAPERTIGLAQEAVDFGDAGLHLGVGLEGKLVQHRPELTAQRLAFGIQLRRAERAQHALHVNDGVFEQRLHFALDMAFRIDAEGLRHLAGGYLGLGGVGESGSGRRVAGGSALAGDRLDRGLQRHQRIDVVLVGRQDESVRAARRDHRLHRLKDLRHCRIVHRRILRCQREQLEQRRPVAG